jgi:hypothetical protein
MYCTTVHHNFCQTKFWPKLQSHVGVKNLGATLGKITVYNRSLNCVDQAFLSPNAGVDRQKKGSCKEVKKQVIIIFLLYFFRFGRFDF